MTPETSRDPNEGQAKVPVSAAPAPAATSEKRSLSSVPSIAAPSGRLPRRFGTRRITIGAIAIAFFAVAVFYAAPTIYRILTTISTDDAYVNGHVTSVAARVPGQVTNVYVDDNYRVTKGSLLVQLDKEPYRIQAALKKANYENAEANLIAANDQVRGLIGQVRSDRFKLQHAIEDVDNQIAVLRANVATLATRRATLVRARADYNRAVELGKTPGAIAPQDVDQKREAFDVAQAQVTQALESVYQIRVGLGLPAKPEKEGDEYLGQVPADLDQTYSSVRQSLFTLLQSAAALNFFPKSYNVSPKQIIEEFYKRDPKGNLDNIYKELIKESPVIKLAQAKRDEAKADWDQAELNLRYCDVVAEIDGVITRRNVNPGNNVQAGEGLMALRSLSEIWVDANFKETQLRNLRIGQTADLEVDMYGSHKTFKGRISGFTYGTGSTLALLPPENATGNFIKVVQRLPVRIDLIDYDPDHDPLFVGLSVVPYVYYKEPGSGPDAGKVLQMVTPLPQVDPDRFRMNPVPAAAQPARDEVKGGQGKAGTPTRPTP